jgi:elongation factor P--(R)-beta-lysine ligase
MDRETIRARGTFIRAIREFFYARNYLETDTPILSPSLIPESSIEAFATVFDPPFGEPLELFMVPSPEIWMKRLIGRGSGDIFQISPCFRNCESVGRIHNPEFTMLEWYTMGHGYRDSLEVAEELFGALASSFPDHPESLEPPFLRMGMAEAFERYAGVDLAGVQDPAAIEAEARRLGLRSSGDPSWEESFNQIFVAFVEPSLPRGKPVALLDYPRQVRCLARDIPGTPWNERWELYVNGIELANCFTEETDGDKVRAYFALETEAKKKARIPVVVDPSYPDIFGPEYPRCSGVAMGVDRLFMAFLGRTSMEALIFFPYSDRIGTGSSVEN